MALLMDVHSLGGGVTVDDVTNAHKADLGSRTRTTSTTCATG